MPDGSLSPSSPLSAAGAGSREPGGVFARACACAGATCAGGRCKEQIGSLRHSEPRESSKLRALQEAETLARPQAAEAGVYGFKYCG